MYFFQRHRGRQMLLVQTPKGRGRLGQTWGLGIQSWSPTWVAWIQQPETVTCCFPDVHYQAAGTIGRATIQTQATQYKTQLP